MGDVFFSVGMSLEPWMLACPRRACIPPPGRPMLPSNSCRMLAARMNCTPSECWVQPTAYTNSAVRSGPELSVRCRQTCANVSGAIPQTRRTMSGV